MILRPIDLGPAAPATVEDLADELARTLVRHLRARLDAMDAPLEDIEARLAAGWRPESSPVADVVERLRQAVV